MLLVGWTTSISCCRWLRQCTSNLSHRLIGWKLDFSCGLVVQTKKQTNDFCHSMGLLPPPCLVASLFLLFFLSPFFCVCPPPLLSLFSFCFCLAFSLPLSNPFFCFCLSFSSLFLPNPHALLSHIPSLSLSVRLSLSVCLSICLSVFLSLSVSLSVCLCLCLSVSLGLCVCLSVCQSVSVYLSVCLSLSVCLYVFLTLSVCLSLSLCLCLSVCLSVSLLQAYVLLLGQFASTLKD